MGTRSPQAVKDEIAEIRSGLDAKLTALEGRLPPLVSTAKKVGVALAGGGAGTVLLFVVRRARAFSRRRRERPGQQAAGVAVQVLPPGTVPVALAVAAIWAGVRLYEAQLRSPSAPDASGTGFRRLRNASSA